MPPFRIEELDGADDALVEQTARVLFEAFRPIEWLKDLDDARGRVRDSVEPAEISFIARDESGRVIGWVGGRHEYAQVWELDPLAVAPDSQRRGVGRALVTALEKRVAAAGGLTLRLGTDDIRLVETGEGRTSLFGIDLYADPLKHLSVIRNLGDHPYEFYLACGFAIVGVVPDANGPGQPDILMAKRVGGWIPQNSPSGV